MIKKSNIKKKRTLKEKKKSVKTLAMMKKESIESMGKNEGNLYVITLMKKRTFKKEGNKRKRKKRDSLNDNAKEYFKKRR